MKTRTPLALFLSTILALFLATIVPFVAHAKKPGADTYKLPDMAYFLERIPPPPAEGSPLGTANLDLTIALQATATPEQIAHAVRTAKYSVFNFDEAVGSRFNAANYPKTADFFKKVEATANIPKNQLKDYFARPRPCDGHPDVVKQLVPYEAGFSYPSGHATRSWLEALILGDLNPSVRLACIRSAAQVGMDRVIGGMHYVTEVVNSRALSQAIYERLQDDPAFKADLEAVRKAEWQTPR